MKLKRNDYLCMAAIIFFFISIALLTYRFHFKTQPATIEGFTSNDIITNNTGIYDKYCCWLSVKSYQ